MLQLLLTGAPGAGKTSLSRLLCAELELEHVATGDLLRENIADDTALGQIAKRCIAQRTLVPDAVVIDMVAQKVAGCKTRKRQGWVLDAFPRTLDQCVALQHKGIMPSVVIVLDVAEAECCRRLTGRRFDPVTSSIYHMPLLLPHDPSVLARLTRRSDDAAERLAPRMEAYRQNGSKVLHAYHAIVHHIDATRRPEDLLDAVLALLHAVRPKGAVPLPLPRTSHDKAPISAAAPTSASVFARKSSHCAIPTRIMEEEEGEHDKEPLHDRLAEFKYDDDDSSRGLPPRSAQQVEPPVVVSVADVNPACSSSPSKTKQAAIEFETEEIQHKEVVQPQQEQASLVSHDDAKTSFHLDASSPPSNNHEEAAGSNAPLASTASGEDANASIQPGQPDTTAEQQQPGDRDADFAKFQNLLLDGLDVLKHGRRGSPHVRTIFTDLAWTRIFWIKPTKDTKAKKAKLDQSLLISEVVQVVRGMKTEVLKRTGDVSKYERYLSLIADDRTLDMELPSEELCELLARGFEHLLQHTTSQAS